jgi:hypothetical protein
LLWNSLFEQVMMLEDMLGRICESDGEEAWVDVRAERSMYKIVVAVTVSYVEFIMASN